MYSIFGMEVSMCSIKISFVYMFPVTVNVCTLIRVRNRTIRCKF